jgi:hypothetical protein
MHNISAPMAASPASAESGTESLDVELADLLAPYVEAVGDSQPAHRP